MGKQRKGSLIEINLMGGIMVHLTTSYSGLIFMVEMQEKSDQKYFVN